MKIFSKERERKNQAGADSTTGSFDEAAARVTAAETAEDAENVRVLQEAAAEADQFTIRPEWAEAAARLCFLPAAKFSHPAYALTDEEAQKISPQLQALMQAIADRYAPAIVGRVANRHPELFDAAAALGVLYWQKWRTVQRIQKEEAEKAAAERAKRPDDPLPFAVPSPLVAGDRAADGSLVI